MNERDHRELARRALEHLRKQALEQAFALDALASPEPLVQQAIESCTLCATGLARVLNDAAREDAAERERDGDG